MAASKKDTKDTKDEKATKDVEPVQPVRVSNHNARDDTDAYEGHAVKVIAGDEEGAKAIFLEVADYADDGYPENIVVRFTDPVHSTELMTLPYKDVVPANYREPDAKAAKYAAEQAEERTIEPDAPVPQVAESE